MRRYNRPQNTPQLRNNKTQIRCGLFYKPLQTSTFRGHGGTPAGNYGICISPLDIAFNKAEAGRPKNIEHLAALTQPRLILPSLNSKPKPSITKMPLYPGQLDKVRT